MQATVLEMRNVALFPLINVVAILVFSIFHLSPGLKCYIASKTLVSCVVKLWDN